MPTLTIFTPTYNRGHLIGRIYSSLLRQTVFDFEWLVIDDGSSDNTQDLFNRISLEKPPFLVRYYKQNNQGLIRTLNKGIRLAAGDYFVKLDSDDYVVDKFAELVLHWIEEIRTTPKVYAVGGLRVTPDGKPIKGVWPKIEKKGFVDASDLERYLYDLNADMTEAWQVDILRRYPFPVWPTEKFAPEQIVFHQIALDGYKIRWRPIPLTICEYQAGGLTLGADKLLKENPMGYAMMYNHKIKIYSDFKNKLFCAMQMTALSFYAGHLEYLKKSNNIPMTILAFFPGLLLGLRRKKQFSKLVL